MTDDQKDIVRMVAFVFVLTAAILITLHFGVWWTRLDDWKPYQRLLFAIPLGLALLFGGLTFIFFTEDMVTFSINCLGIAFLIAVVTGLLFGVLQIVGFLATGNPTF